MKWDNICGGTGREYIDGDRQTVTADGPNRIMGGNKMNGQLKTVLELSRDPMLAVRDRRIVYVNNAAAIALPELKPETRASEVLPPQLLAKAEGSFVASVGMNGKAYTVSGADCGDFRLLSFAPRSAAESRGVVSDGLLNDLLSTLFSAELSAGHIASALQDNGDASLPRLLSMLTHSHYSLRRQLTNLNLALQLREGSVYFAPRRTELVGLFAGLTADVASLSGERNASVDFYSTLPELYALADASMLEKLLLNLLSNALAHTPPEGCVQVRLKKNGENAILSVDDNGEGISPEVLRNVFARYEQRLDGAHLDRGASAGLGLGVAEGIARLHGGTMVLESREGKGTSARAMLPLKKPATEPLGAVDESHDGLHAILTELSGVLDHKCYTGEYLD